MQLQVNLLWIPYIIFRNTDSDEAVTLDGELRTLVAVTREGGFVRSGPEVADEVSFRPSHCIVFYFKPWNYRWRFLEEKKI